MQDHVSDEDEVHIPTRVTFMTKITISPNPIHVIAMRPD